MAPPPDLPDLERLGRAPRLALAYAPAGDRELVAAIMLLDEQLAGFVRNASEPMLAQMRLAWWRDRFAQDPGDWPKGNPLLARLAGLGPSARQLSAVVDGWEQLVGERPLSGDDIEAHAQGRAAGWTALADYHAHLDVRDDVRRAATKWALVDFAWHDGDEAERTRALSAARDLDPATSQPRSLRSLGVLAGLATRSLAKDRPPLSQASDMMTALRVGLFGR